MPYLLRNPNSHSSKLMAQSDTTAPVQDIRLVRKRQNNAHTMCQLSCIEHETLVVSNIPLNGYAHIRPRASTSPEQPSPASIIRSGVVSCVLEVVSTAI